MGVECSTGIDMSDAKESLFLRDFPLLRRPHT